MSNNMDKKLVTLIKISILSSLAFIIMLMLEFPLPIFPDFLKLDFSDLPALLGAFAMGPVAGIIIELVKNILHAIIKGGSAGIGELANFIVGAALVGTAGLMYKREKSRKNALVSLFAGVLVMSVIAAAANYFIFLPLYESVLNFPIDAVVGIASKVNSNVKDLNTLILYTIFPFNLLKGAVAAALTFAVYKKLSPILHK